MLSETIFLFLGETLCVDGCVLGLTTKKDDSFLELGEILAADSWLPTRNPELCLLVKVVAGYPLKVVCGV